MAKARNEEPRFVCPVGKFFKDLQCGSGERSQFHQHMTLCGVEFLKAIRSVVDEGIERLEKGPRGGQGRKATRIKVE
ncbi:MAG: hypothetical protein AB1512_31015 [Thermodesulfobacteriota bacterium]